MYFYCVILTQAIAGLITHRHRSSHSTESQQSLKCCLKTHRASQMQLEDRQHLSMGNGTLMGHADLCMWPGSACTKKKASLLHKWLEFNSTGRADEITSPGWPGLQTEPAQLVQFCSLKTCSVSVVQPFISVGCFRRYGRDPKSGRTCFVVVEGFSWTRLNNIYWTKVCSCWSCSGLTGAWLRSFIFSFIC